jgi:hypothetical protein
VFDQVTELPERATFQAALEAALVHVQEKSRPAVLLLLGPDDFGWVNDRLDRRAGDLVLREIATVLRGGLRTHDHIARLRRRDLLRHPARHDARGRPLGRGERGSPPGGPPLPREDPAPRLQRRRRGRG